MTCEKWMGIIETKELISDETVSDCMKSTEKTVVFFSGPIKGQGTKDIEVAIRDFNEYPEFGASAKIIFDNGYSWNDVILEPDTTNIKNTAWVDNVDSRTKGDFSPDDF